MFINNKGEGTNRHMIHGVKYRLDVYAAIICIPAKLHIHVDMYFERYTKLSTCICLCLHKMYTLKTYIMIF